MEPETVGTVLDAIDRAWGLPDSIEVTLEANPTSVEADRFQAFRDAGVNRVSMGIQALNNSDLRALGRMHTFEEAQNAFAIARDAFERVSFDLIYARPDQTPEAWAKELKLALDMAVDHLSLYQLTIEPGTRYWDLRERGGLRGLPSDDRGAALYDVTQEICESAGMPAYEISNHARSGAESAHNLIYWRYGFYAGVGPGAHGRLPVNGTRIATETPLGPLDWLSTVETSGIGINDQDVLGVEDQRAEALLMGLRLREGVPLSRMAQPLDRGSIDLLCNEDLLWFSNGWIGATSRGRAVLNAVIGELLR
jgi:oxygen-independent coproporphyrinogen-3 oxidase